MHIAITCVTNDLLRNVASLALRHAGFRVIDTDTFAEAISAAERSRPDLVLVGILADPAGELVRWCADRQIQAHIISSQMTVAELGQLLNRIAAAVDALPER